MNTTLNEKEIQLVEAYRQWMQDAQQQHANQIQVERDFRNILEALRTPVSRTTPVDLIPTDEMEERLGILRELLVEIRDWLKTPDLEYTRGEMAAALCLPLHRLRNLSPARSTPQWDESLIQAMNMVLRPEQNEKQKPLAGTKRKANEISTNTASSDKNTTSSRGNRSSAARTGTRRRDGAKCIFTGHAIFDFCHIFPWSVNANEHQLKTFKLVLNRLEIFFPVKDFKELKGLLTKERGCSDEYWNMLALSTTLHRLLGKLKFGLVWLGSRPDHESLDENGVPRKTIATLQLRWLEHGSHKPGDKVSLDGERDQVFQRLLGNDPIYFTDRGNRVYDVASNKELLSGATADITMDTKDASKMKLMIELQWLCLKLRVLSGAAGYDDFDFDDDESPPASNPESIEEESDIGQAASERLHEWLSGLPGPNEQRRS